MIKLSDTIHHIPLNDFEITGDFDKDVKKYTDLIKMPIERQNLDHNAYVTLLFRLNFGKTMTVHTLTDGVIKKIKQTKIENVPSEIPKFMKHSFLIEARHDKTLFGDIYSIGGFSVNDEICLLIGTQGGFYCQHEKATFDGRNIEELNLVYNPIVNSDQHFVKLKTRKDTFAFITILSLMLEAEKTSFLIESKKEKSNNKILDKKSSNRETEWITKRIYIDKDIKYKTTTKDHSILDKDGKLLKNVTVTGFLRKQRYGKDLLETKWVYIDSYDSKRWTNTKDTKIIVDIYGEK